MDATALRVVVIEDNLQTAEMIADFLKEKFAGTTVTIYNTGESAVNGMTQEPDIVVCDYLLDSAANSMTGLDVLKKIRQTYSCPVIFLTGQEKPEVSANIIQYGAYDYIVKNQDSFHRLEIIINNILEGRKVKQDLMSHKKSVHALLVLVVALITGLVLFKIIW
jgi:CheY-like chemotaxis protein